jgi:hypothetical protein
MNLHHQLFDGSWRPPWAGPVTVMSRRRSVRPGRMSQRVVLSGVVLPVRVHPGAVPSSGHQHTFGLGLGFPDLSNHFLNASPRESRLTKSWATLENTIAEAAAQVMGWGGSIHPRDLSRADLPRNALHLALTGEIIRDRNDAPNGVEPESVTGELTKVFPIRDVSGRQLRMERTGASATLKLTPHLANWSRHPGSL